MWQFPSADMPTLGVFAVIFDDSSNVCCVRIGYAHKGWTTPGGRVEPGESPTEALKREVMEETGLLIEVDPLIGVYSKPDVDDVILNFEASVIEETEWETSSEIAEVSYFSREELPAPMTKVTRKRIEDGFSRARGVFREFSRAESVVAT